MKERNFLKLLIYLWPFLLLVVLLTLFFRLRPTPNGGVAALTLPETKKIAISTLMEVNKFIISVAYIIIGFCGSVLAGKIFTKRTRASDFFLFLGCVLALIAIFLGYYLYDTLILLLNNNITDLEEDTILWIRKWQFFFIVSAAISFLIFIYNNSLKITLSNEPDLEKEMD
jgi:hypothetical protein